MAEAQRKIEFRPQDGPQTIFHASPADIAFFGGGAGPGKTWSILFEPTRHISNPDFPGVVFRRTSPMITAPGGIWDESLKMYTPMGLKPRTSPKLDWRVPRRKDGKPGWRLTMSHMEHEKHRLAWQGAQLAYIGYDELTHFAEIQFWYMISRLRSMSGVPGYCRATMNPDPDSFVRALVDWWIGEDGLAIPERSGVVRYFARDKGNIIWADSREELLKEGFEADQVLSFTFVAATVYDNKILLQKDPSYLSKLKALPLVEREQLLGGNWNIRPAAGSFFRKEWFPVINAAPADTVRIRYWDRAATSEVEAREKKKSRDPDWTVGLRLSKTRGKSYVVEDVVRFRGTPLEVKEAIRNTAAQDGVETIVGIEQDPGQAGKAEALYYVQELAGYDVRCYPVNKAKTTRAKPVSAQVEQGNVKVVRAPWNDLFFRELQSFPSQMSHDDQVDALSGAFQAIVNEDFAEPVVWSV